MACDDSARRGRGRRPLPVLAAPSPGDDVVFVNGGRLGRVGDVFPDCFKVDVSNGGVLWLQPEAVFHSHGGTTSLICDELGVTRYFYATSDARCSDVDLAPPPAPTTIVAIARHRVKEVEGWTETGSPPGAIVLRSLDDEQEVTVLRRFDSVEQARDALMTTRALDEAEQRGSDLGALEVRLYEEL